MEDEIGAFEEFRDKYRVMHPPPRRPNAARLDWKFWLVLLVVPAQILLAALRTASIFFKAAELGGSETLAYIEAILAIMAVEVSLVVYSAIKAAKRTTVSDWVMNLGVVLMVGISVFAGLSQSIHLVEGIDPQSLKYLQYGVSFMVGIGASIIAWIGGEILGSQVALMGIKNREIMGEFQAEQEDYNDRIVASWNASHERRIVRADLIKESRSVSSDVRSLETTERTDRKAGLRNYGSSEVRDSIERYIADIFNRDGRIAGPTEVHEALDVSKGYASDVINQWVKDNSL